MGDFMNFYNNKNDFFLRQGSHLNSVLSSESVDYSDIIENADLMQTQLNEFELTTKFDSPYAKEESPCYINNEEQYMKLYRESIEQPEQFWDKLAKTLKWMSPYTEVQSKGDRFVDKMNWFLNGKLNACENCVDRWAEKYPDRCALIWEGDEVLESRKITYKELFINVCKFANGLKSLGVKKGDAVGIYMPMIPETAYAMLACARIGAVHTVVFAGFSASNLRERLINANCKILITADQSRRGSKIVPLKDIVDEALANCSCVRHCIVFHHINHNIKWFEQRDIDGETLVEEQRPYCPLEYIDSEDPLFYLYTSGSTGKPKAIVHTTAGYLLFVSITQKYLFDVKEGDIFGCVGDIGWITGHSYLLYASLCNGITTLMFEGVPTYPDPGRYWSLVENHKITHFYTAPTALRSIHRFGDEWVEKYDLSSLRILGSVGEPIDTDTWKWYYDVIGKKRCPIIDTYWQTETGGIIIAPMPAWTVLKPSSATRPFFGIDPVLIDSETGVPISGPGVGILCIRNPWPGMFRTILSGNHLVNKLYLSPYENKYFTGDGAMRDAEGYYWITGRVDDTINVAGHRLGTKEVEDALTRHPKVSESAAVGIPHEIKGTAIICFVVLSLDKENLFESTIKSHSALENPNFSAKSNSFFDESTVKIQNELRQLVRTQIGPIATPDVILIVPGLPKTRSGKCVRRILRKITTESSDHGDTSTLLNSVVVDQISDKWKEYKKSLNINV